MLDQTSHQPHLAALPPVALYVPNRRPCKYVGLHRIPLRQPDDLRRAVYKIKSDLAPFAVVVRLIQVDSGGSF